MRSRTKKCQTPLSKRTSLPGLMSFTSILNELKHKGGSPQPRGASYKSIQARAKQSQQQVPINAVPKDYSPAPVDPAVQRLKEQRRLEKEQEATLKKKTQSPKPKAVRPPRQVTRKDPAVTKSTAQRASASPIKRLTFQELLKEAERKTKNLGIQEPAPGSDQIHVSKSKRELKSAMIPRKHTAAKVAEKRVPTARVVKPTGPKPMAKPSAKLAASLAAKRKSREEYFQPQKQEKDDYESDDFVVDDKEDNARDEGFDRDEIWKMFGRDRNRYTYDDDDLSDMEATGEEIFREETRAAKRALMEEREEADREKRRVQEKKRRLGRI